MPNFDAQISGFAIGDDIIIRRTINRSASNLPTGVTITKAWLTVKEDYADLDGAAIVSKIITTVEDAGNNGHIEEDGSASAGTANPVLRFDLLSTDTRAIGANHRYYDIQVQTSASGAIYTGEIGVIFGVQDVTIADT
jgi:hypothetical protein